MLIMHAVLSAGCPRWDYCAGPASKRRRAKRRRGAQPARSRPFDETGEAGLPAGLRRLYDVCGIIVIVILCNPELGRALQARGRRVRARRLRIMPSTAPCPAPWQGKSADPRLHVDARAAGAAQHAVKQAQGKGTVAAAGEFFESAASASRHRLDVSGSDSSAASNGSAISSGSENLAAC